MNLIDRNAALFFDRFSELNEGGCPCDTEHDHGNE